MAKGLMMELGDPRFFINRELSWLRFNSRVLEEAKNASLPLLERLKFLAIYGTNLDEFYMIRVAGLKELFKAGMIVSGPDKLTPLEQLREIRRYLHHEKQQVQAIFNEIMAGLEAEGIAIKKYDDLSDVLKKKIDKYFYENLYPVIIPIAVDPTHPFPHLNNLSFGLVIKLCDIDNNKEIKYGLVRIPRVLPRFIEIEANIYVTIESVVERHIVDLFPGYNLLASTPFRVTRNADIAIEEEEADDFLELLEEGLRLRKKGEIIRLEIGKDADKDLIEFINSHIRVFKDDIYAYEILLNLGSLWQIAGNKNFAHLISEPYTPKILPPLESKESIFKIIDSQEVMLFHPYESFDPVVRFIQEAAKDPLVLAIRMTLYRVGKDSPVVKALIDAAADGKQVTAVVELKARFDEENNLIWAKALEDAGAHVVYGIPGFKVHAKTAQVIKKGTNGLRQYVHISTGNYNINTARIYTDISILTSRKEYTEDITRFFHFLTGFSKKGKLSTLYMAPTQLKPKIMELIENEAAKKEEGRIIAKMNALVDSNVIEALYKASMAGTKIDLIVRGICCLRPGIKGVSDNIRVISIVGKYLEHGRIFYFKHSNPQIYISSADWMPRNTERRIELMTPVLNKEIAEKLFEILKLQSSDTVLARELQENGEYIKCEPAEGKPVNSQKITEEFISMLYASTKKESATKVQKIAARLFKES